MLKFLTAIVLICLMIAPVCADRLIITPTGTTLTGLKAEYAANSDGDGKAYWAQIGVSRFEIEGARFTDFGPDDVDVVSAQVSIMPETSFTPAVSLGMRDIGDEAEGMGTLYEKQAFYLAASKGIPVTGGVPVLFQDMKVHGGVGTGSLSGVFFGVEGTLPMGLHLVGEYDTDDFNFSASYRLVPTLKVRVSSIKGDVYYGGLFSASF